MRIISLLPSATEILFAIGAGDDVVGVTFECDFPPEARQRRIVSTSSIPAGLAAAEIDAHVSGAISRGEDLYHLDEGAFAGLDADLVVTQDLCAVCAVDVSVVEDALAHLGCTADVLTLDPHTLAEVAESVRALGEATGHAESATRLLAGTERRLATVRESLAGLPRPRVVVLEWADPPFAPGHWVPEMVREAGGESVLGRAGARSYRVTWDEVRSAAPDVVVCAPCGYHLQGAVREAGAVLRELPRKVQVWAVDANASYARPGPRLVDGIETLARILHPGTGTPSTTSAERSS